VSSKSDDKYELLQEEDDDDEREDPYAINWRDCLRFRVKGLGFTA
jgi:hypothetical protein